MTFIVNQSNSLPDSESGKLS